MGRAFKDLKSVQPSKMNKMPAAHPLFLLFFPFFFNLLAQVSLSATCGSPGWRPPAPMQGTLLKQALEFRKTDLNASTSGCLSLSQDWKPCISPKTNASPEATRGFIQVFLDGGINQQRMGICDAVAVAKILNATLVVPYLEENRVWKDPSEFADVFDVEKFIEVLRGDLPVVRSLPEEYSWSTREYYGSANRETRIKTAPLRASARWYLKNVLPVLTRYGVVAISPFSHRLGFDDLPPDIQKLRCKVNFQALTFVPRIVNLGEALLRRLRNTTRSELAPPNSNRGAFVALHLRFEKDMVAHSACDFGGGKVERLQLARYRKKLWRGRVLNSRFTNKELRIKGRCPLTPEEIGLTLAAMGFDRQTRLFLATHKVYGGKVRLTPLRQLFPLVEDKKSLASVDELEMVEGRASLLAAIDYYVSIHSDVFVSASPSNMHNVVMGQRIFWGLPTLRLNMGLLGRLFLNKSLGWEEFGRMVRTGHGGVGEERIRLRREKQSIYKYPAPDCMCRM